MIFLEYKEKACLVTIPHLFLMEKEKKERKKDVIYGIAKLKKKKKTLLNTRLYQS